VNDFARRLVPDGLWGITEPLVPVTPTGPKTRVRAVGASIGSRSESICRPNVVNTSIFNTAFSTSCRGTILPEITCGPSETTVTATLDAAI
jgi:hypothetical protein